MSPRRPDPGGTHLPELRETPLGRFLSRFLLPLTLAALALLVWAGLGIVERFDLDAPAPAVGVPRE